MSLPRPRGVPRPLAHVRTSRVVKPSIHCIQLKNGIRLLAIDNPEVDIVAAHLFWQGGASAGFPRKIGLANLTASVLTKGTSSRNASHIAETVESMGALLGAECAPDYFALSLKSVASDFPSLFHLASDIIRNPSFPASEVERERQLVLQGIRAQQERPFSVAFTPVREALFGKHPYAFSMAGTAESVATLDRMDLVAYHRNQLRSDNLVIAISGNISPTEVESLVANELGDWTTALEDSVEPSLPEFPHLQGERTLTNHQSTQQTIAIVGYRAPSIYSDDWTALKLLAVHLGGGLSSRLFVQLREKQGLAYEVSASYSPRRYEAPFMAYIGTAPESTDRALLGLRKELQRLVERPLTPDELQLAKRKILGQYALSKQTNSQLAQLVGWYELLGLGVEYDLRYPDMVGDLTSSQLQQVAERYLGNPVISVAGPERPTNN